MNKKRLIIQISISLAIVLIFGVIIAITYSSLIKKSKFNFAKESLKNAALEVLLEEGIDSEFSGLLVYSLEENETYTPYMFIAIDEKMATLIAQNKAEPVYHLYGTDDPNFSVMQKYAGLGITESENQVLHVKLKKLSVTYYKAL